MSYFLQLADAGKKAMIEAGKEPVMAYFDLNGMKLFNEKYGLQEGDKIIHSTKPDYNRNHRECFPYG